MVHQTNETRRLRRKQWKNAAYPRVQNFHYFLLCGSYVIGSTRDLYMRICKRNELLYNNATICPPLELRVTRDRDRWAALAHRPSHQNRLSSTAAPNWHRVTDYQEAFNILWAPLLRICFSSWVRNTSNSKTMTQTRRSEIRTLNATIVHRWSNRTDSLVRSNSSLFLSECRQRRMHE